MDEVLYMLDMLIDKAYNYVKHSLNMLCIYPNNLSKWAFSNRESMFAYIKKHYKTIDITQAAKNKLDTLN